MIVPYTSPPTPYYMIATMATLQARDLYHVDG